MSEHDFTKLYQTWTTAQLLAVIENTDDYQPLAVTAAQQELNHRSVSKEDLAIAKEVLIAEQKQKQSVEQKIKTVGVSLANQLNPIQKAPLAIDQQIKLILFFLILLSSFKLYKSFGLVLYMFTYDGPWELSMVLFLIELFIVPVATVLYWLGKRWGWVLAEAYLSFAASSAVVFLFSALNRGSIGSGALNAIFPVTSPLAYVGSLLLFGIAAWGMTKRNIREVYGIDRRTMLLSVGAGVLVTLMIRLVI